MSGIVAACPRGEKKQGPTTMTNAPPPDDGPCDPEPPRRVPSPRRGAIPTPRSVIEKATPYVPDVAPAEGEPDPKPDPPVSADK